MLRNRKNYKYYAELSGAKNFETSNGRKIPRRSAAVAASKIKLISDGKDELSSPEVVSTRRKNRKLLHRDTSAAVRIRKAILDDSPSPSESEKEIKEYELKEQRFQTFSYTAEKIVRDCKQKHLDSENERMVTQKSRHSKALRQKSLATIGDIDPKTEQFAVGVSEESSSNSFTCEDQHVLSQSQAPGHNISSNCTADLEQELGNGSKALKGTSETVNGEQIQRTSVLRKSRKPGASRNSQSEPEGSSNYSSDSNSQTESPNINNSGDRDTRRRKRKAGRTLSNGVSEPSKIPQRRKRAKVKEENDSEELDYTKYKRVNRRSKIRTRNGGRRTVRYADDEDDCEM